MANTLHVKKGDTVVLLTGKYKDKYEVKADAKDEAKDAKSAKAPKRKTGTVVQVSPKEGKVIVEGINMVTKHVKPRKAGDQGGIVKAEAPLYACKVMAVCPSCKKPTRPAYTFVEGKDGKMTKQRICKHCKKAY